MKPFEPQPLTPEAFAPFGDVIQTAGAEHFAINDGSCERYDDLARLNPGPGGRLTMNIFRGRPFTWPVPLVLLERHPLGSQAFVPLDGRPYLVAVAQGGDRPDLDNLRVFLAGAGQGVNYLAGVWHHPLLALEAVSDFLVVDRGSGAGNCEVFRLPEGIVVTEHAPPCTAMQGVAAVPAVTEY